MLRRLTLLGVLVLASSCSIGEDERRRSRDEFCGQWARSACTTETRQACQAASPEACRESQKSFCLTLVPDTFYDDREKTDACLKAVERAYQDANLTATELATVLRLGKPCDQVVQGPRARGEVCTTDRDCNATRGFACIRKGGSVEGTCEVPERVGGGFACDEPQHLCDAGFYCNGENCIATKKPGAACTSQDECGAQAFCAENGTCVARLPLREPCQNDDQCASGLCFEFASAGPVCVDFVRLSLSEPLCTQLH